MNQQGAKIILVNDSDGTRREKEFCDKIFLALQKENISDKVQIVRAAELGVHNKGLVVKVLPENIMYSGVKEENISDIVRITVVKGKTINELKCDYKDKQVRIVLRNCGIIDPENIDDYLYSGGYRGLKKVLFDFTPEQSIEELKISGLRGRGGGGFRTRSIRRPRAIRLVFLPTGSSWRR